MLTSVYRYVYNPWFNTRCMTHMTKSPVTNNSRLTVTHNSTADISLYMNQETYPYDICFYIPHPGSEGLSWLEANLLRRSLTSVYIYLYVPWFKTRFMTHVTKLTVAHTIADICYCSHIYISQFKTRCMAHMIKLTVKHNSTADICLYICIYPLIQHTMHDTYDKVASQTQF